MKKPSLEGKSVRMSQESAVIGAQSIIVALVSLLALVFDGARTELLIGLLLYAIATIFIVVRSSVKK